MQQPGKGSAALATAPSEASFVYFMRQCFLEQTLGTLHIQNRRSREGKGVNNRVRDKVSISGRKNLLCNEPTVDTGTMIGVYRHSFFSC